ncbi:MAG: SDR family oxidoreductase [Bacteroidia bacterium]|nr:SDR family oxidoreductase [Bacteroidia bacterium]
MVIIITGASKGIGYQTALQLSADKNNTVIAISRSEKGLKKLAEKSHGSIITISFDLKMYKGIPSLLVSEIKRFTKHVDVLINNAGILIKKNLDALSATEIEDAYSVNVFAPMLLIKGLLPMMGGTRATHIINISSMGGIKGSVKFPGLSAYSSTKAALINLSECLAVELKEKNIAVNCVTFGSVKTEMFGEAFPTAKAALSVDDAAKYLADFCLKGNKYFNGKVLEVSSSTP